MRTVTSKPGYRFGACAQQMFDYHFPRKAASEIMKQKPDHFEAAKNEARGNFRKLIDQMFAETNSIDKYNATYPGVIGELTLSKAMRKLCPLWPICE